ncbi:SDR family NAD(P)-dependent oxidoreductase [Planctomicrobium sp. SH664]|uniref:SDR family NAD(P)-dependent oxidoreductase n=1 Tax=Planctomicrobium sp. SH664 TaxID=3448125 RepID=UPI003F5B3997
MSGSVVDMFSLEGQVALVTGGSGHLGFAMAQGLAEAGASVIISSRSLARGEEVARRLPRVAKAEHGAVQLDQLDEASIQSGFEAATAQRGKIDVLVNNAHDVLGADWKSVTGQQFQRQLENLTGYFLLSRCFHDHVVSRSASGSLILIGSMYGVTGSYPDVYAGIGPANPVAYQALKGGVIQMTRHLAVYWAREGIRVNCLSPGPFPGAGAPAELLKRIVDKSPMQRVGTPDELKGAVVFLASQASSYLTGQNLIVDGGWTAW